MPLDEFFNISLVFYNEIIFIIIFVVDIICFYELCFLTKFFFTFISLPNFSLIGIILGINNATTFFSFIVLIRYIRLFDWFMYDSTLIFTKFKRFISKFTSIKSQFPDYFFQIKHNCFYLWHVGYSLPDQL